LGAIAKGEFVERDRKPVLVSELYEALERYYRVNARKSADALARRWKHLKGYFGDTVAQNVTTERLEEYIDSRIREGAANATVNRELACLKTAFRIGYGKRRLPRLPLFPHLKEDNARTGFVEDADYARLTANAGELWLRLFLELAYTYGWRKAELLGLRVRQCDLIATSIRLEAAQSKNGQAREAVMTGAVCELVKQAVAGKGPDDFLLTREGNKPVRDFRKAWRNLAISAGLGKMICRDCGKTVITAKCECGSRGLRYVGKIVHDFRRSAARALRRAGVAESVIMSIGGWKTAAMFRRYAIVSQSDQKVAVEKLEQQLRENSRQATFENSRDFSHDSASSAQAEAKAMKARLN
jgi:integrase